jgi:hypothetical protein
MKTLFIILGVVIIFLILIYFVFFRPSQVKERRLKQKKRLLKEENLTILRNQYLHEYVFFSREGYCLFDKELNLIKDFGEYIINIDIYQDSILPSLVPVKISSIRMSHFGDEYCVNCIPHSIEYEFEIIYCGDFNAIAKSPILGEVYLEKKKFLQYLVGKKINIRFELISINSSRKDKEIVLKIIN